MVMLSSSWKLFLSFCPVCVHVCEWIVLPILYEEKQKRTTISKSVIIGRPANLLIDCKYRLNEAHNNHEYIVLSIRKIDLIQTTLNSQIGLIEMKWMSVDSTISNHLRILNGGGNMFTALLCLLSEIKFSFFFSFVANTFAISEGPSLRPFYQRQYVDL